MLAYNISAMNTNITPVEIDSVKSIYSFLKNQNSQLKQAQLEQLIPFNSAYRVITKNFQTTFQNDFFQEPEEFALLDVVFARFYVDALDDYYIQESLPTVWNKLLVDKKLPIYIQLLLGANAHINKDLPLALQKLSYAQQLNIKVDYFAADKIFWQSSREIINSLYEPSPINNLVRNYMRILYEKPMIAMIVHWRHKAWKNSLALRNGSLTTEQLVSRSNKIADTIIEFCS